MRHFLLFISIASTILFSCNNSLEDSATKWTRDVKRKVIEDASQTPDNSILDSSRSELILLKNGNKLKYYTLRPSFDRNRKIIAFDTAVSILYSTDQKFELVKEHCPIVDRRFEGLRFNGYWVGRLEYRFCNGKLKNIHYNYNENIGVEREYDSTGKLIKEVDHGATHKLEKLKEIKYYR